MIYVPVDHQACRMDDAAARIHQAAGNRYDTVSMAAATGGLCTGHVARKRNQSHVCRCLFASRCLAPVTERAVVCSECMHFGEAR